MRLDETQRNYVRSFCRTHVSSLCCNTRLACDHLAPQLQSFNCFKMKLALWLEPVARARDPGCRRQGSRAAQPGRLKFKLVSCNGKIQPPDLHL
jgi:hypothetical protein